MLNNGFRTNSSNAPTRFYRNVQFECIRFNYFIVERGFLIIINDIVSNVVTIIYRYHYDYFLFNFQQTARFGRYEFITNNVVSYSNN